MLVQMKDTGGLAQHERNRRQHQHSDDRCQRRRATGATPRLRQRSASPGYWLHARFACLTVVGIFSRHRSRAKSTSEVQYADNACTNARSLLLLATGLPSETSRGYVCTLTHHLLLSLLSLSTSPLEGPKTELFGAGGLDPQLTLPRLCTGSFPWGEVMCSNDDEEEEEAEAVRRRHNTTPRTPQRPPPLEPGIPSGGQCATHGHSTSTRGAARWLGCTRRGAS